MSCLIDSGLTGSTCFGQGGVKALYLANYDLSATYTYDAEEVLTGVTNSPTFYKMNIDTETAGLTQQGVTSVENGTVYFETNLTAKFFNGDKVRIGYFKNEQVAAEAYILSLINKDKYKDRQSFRELIKSYL